MRRARLDRCGARSSLHVLERETILMSYQVRFRMGIRGQEEIKEYDTAREAKERLTRGLCLKCGA